ncbi:MAG TPA: FAD-binding oxidoreductase [Burkholderiaceae bacterium]|nr:FAD-binding oxidoreductase [Burkholderiaceae bacterium]
MSAPATSAAPSYYEATADRGPPRAPLSGAHDAEVCIVGAGFAGLATALGLIERGVQGIVLLEAGRIACGASGRNGGFVFGGYSLGGAELVAQLGAEEARACYGLTQTAVDLIRHRIAAYAIECEAVDGGALLANWFDDDAILDREQRLLREHFGVEWRRIGRDELARQVVTTRYSGALFEPDAFHFHPLKYALGIARAAQAGGVLLHEHSAVRAVERLADGRFRVATDGGTLRARHVVIAGGGTLRGVLPALERATLPIATYVMATEPLGARLEALIPGRAAIYDTRFAFDYYRRLNDTRLLWGGRISVRDRRPEQIARFLRADMLRVFPSLEDARIDFAWGGLMSYARHKMPQIGRMDGGALAGVWHACGFGGHGVAPTTVAGEALAEAISGRRALPDAFRRYGLARTWRPFGLLAAQAAYHLAELKDAWRGRR